jgi:hypothetical protein
MRLFHNFKGNNTFLGVLLLLKDVSKTFLLEI